MKAETQWCEVLGVSAESPGTALLLEKIFWDNLESLKTEPPPIPEFPKGFYGLTITCTRNECAESIDEISWQNHIKPNRNFKKDRK